MRNLKRRFHQITDHKTLILNTRGVEVERQSIIPEVPGSIPGAVKSRYCKLSSDLYSKSLKDSAGVNLSTKIGSRFTRKIFSGLYLICFSTPLE